MDISRMSGRDLLGVVIGPKAAHSLYQGSLAPLFHNQPYPTRETMKLRAAKELVTRMLEETLEARDALGSPNAVREYLITRYSYQEHESFIRLFLDAQNRLIACEEIFRGTLTQTAVYPREVVKIALRHNAAAVIFAHNHPSGVAEPSQADRWLTDALMKALALVDVKLLDHFLVAGNHAVSMAERGMV